VKPLAVIFDWDVTLVDSIDAIKNALNDTFIKFDQKEDIWSRHDVSEWLRKSMRVSFKDLFKDKAKNATDYFYLRYRDQHLKTVSPMPGAIETLKTLSSNSVYLAVVSSKKGNLVRAEAAELNIESFFAKIVGSSDAREDKPQIAPMELALSKADFNLSANIWYVGDCGIDVVCAQNSGCSSIIIGEKPSYVGEKIYVPDQHFSNHESFQKFINNIFKFV